MAKILGIHERVGAGGLLSRDVQGIGLYEDATVAERRSPYEIRSFGQSREPYDLMAPGAVAEIKRALIALNSYWSDPNFNPSDTQIEDTFKHIDVSPEFIDAWDGPTADTFALTVGRHKDRFPALMPPARQEPLIQLPKFRDIHGNDVIVGGPQPTVAGLEALAQAAHEVLKDTVQLDQYLAWRGGVLDCVGMHMERCIPPDALVTPTKRMGRPWDERGWTIAWRDGPNANENLLGTLDLLDESLGTSWTVMPHEPTEQRRRQRADATRDLRKQRHDIVKQLNEGVPLPECKNPANVYDRPTGLCKPRCQPPKTWDQGLKTCVLVVGPPVYADHAHCMKEQRKVASEEEAKDLARLFKGWITLSTG